MKKDGRHKKVCLHRQMTNCPSGKGPTSEILSNMHQCMKLKMAGRIIMDNGDVYDLDTHNVSLRNYGSQ